MINKDRNVYIWQSLLVAKGTVINRDMSHCSEEKFVYIQRAIILTKHVGNILSHQLSDFSKKNFLHKFFNALIGL